MTSTNETIQAVQFVNLRTATNTLISDIWKKFIKMVETHLLEGKVLVNPNVQPDPNDPNFYCSSCGRNYKTRANYRKHIRLYHPSIKLEKIRKPSNVTTLMAEIDVGDDGNKRCAICEWEYDNRQNYKKHINTVHKNGGREPVKLKTNAPMAEMDAGNHNNTRCTICERGYSDRSGYRVHMSRYHRDGRREPVVSTKGKKANMDKSVIPI